MDLDVVKILLGILSEMRKLVLPEMAARLEPWILDEVTSFLNKLEVDYETKKKNG